MTIQHSRSGAGPPLVLVHGLGGTRRAWDTVVGPLRASRTLVAIDLPGHGESAAEADSGTFAGLVRSVEAFLEEHALGDAALVGSSLGARIVLEHARRRASGPVVALDPGGFWRGWERTWFRTTLLASLGLLRGLGPARARLARMAPTRSALLAQLSAHPWRLDPDLVARELDSIVATPTFAALVRDLAAGPEQAGPAVAGSGPVTIGWGRHDRLCRPAQAERAMQAFPGSHLHWFAHSGHYPMWDSPDETAELILRATA